MEKSKLLFSLLLCIGMHATAFKQKKKFEIPLKSMRWTYNQSEHLIEQCLHPKKRIVDTIVKKCMPEDSPVTLFNRYQTSQRALLKTFLTPGADTACALLSHCLSLEYLDDEQRQTSLPGASTIATHYALRVARTLAWKLCCAEAHLQAPTLNIDKETLSWFLPDGPSEDIITLTFDNGSLSCSIGAAQNYKKGLCQLVSKKCFMYALQKCVLDPACSYFGISGTFQLPKEPIATIEINF